MDFSISSSRFLREPQEPTLQLNFLCVYPSPGGFEWGMTDRVDGGGGGELIIICHSPT